MTGMNPGTLSRPSSLGSPQDVRSPDRLAVGEPLLHLRGAAVRFGAREALRDVSLTIHRGDRIALVGANGGGKTTLLRLLHGLLPSATGTGSQERLQGARCAMLFQRPFLLRFSVSINVSLALWLAGVPRRERAQRVAEALDRVGLTAQADDPARSLSGGQQQRLAFARALAVRPDILFLDEPTSSLDPSAKKEVEALIEQLGRDGQTLVMSSHNLGQVKRLATRVVHLHEGRVVVDLPTERFFADDALHTLPPQAAQFLKGELPWH